MTPLIDIAIADDETLFRKGIQILVEGFDNMKVSLEAENGQDLLDQLNESENLSDILLLDLNMPVLDGVETAQLLQGDFPDLKVIILSSYFSKAFIINMIELGVSGYLAKNSLPEEVEKTIREVADKGFSYGDKIMEVIRENMIKKKKVKPSFAPSLTERETEILQLICEQYTAAEIGEKLFISPLTVDGHRNNLLQKLHCRNTAGLVVYGLQNGLVKMNGEMMW